MKQIGLLLILPIVFALSCGTAPEPQGSGTQAEQPEPAAEPVQTAPPEQPVQPVAPPEEKVFDPQSITDEMFANTKADVQALIADLNRIIRARNFNGWVAYLAETYYREISSAAFLEERTDELYKRDQIVAQNTGRDPRLVQKKNLRTARDYFENVVVPSRSNDRMDEIDFLSENRVRAYTVDTRGTRLILYDLELIDKMWKIIN